MIKIPPKTKKYPQNHPLLHKNLSPEKREIKNKKDGGNFRAIFISFLLILGLLSFFMYKSIRNHQNTLLKKLQNSGQELVKLNSKVQTIDAQQVMFKIRDDRFQIIDIRNFSAFLFFHIESSTNIPFEKIEESFSEIKKNKSLVIIDSFDTQEARILSNHLAEEGLNVFYAKGGLQEFTTNGYPVVKIPDPQSAGARFIANPLKVQDVLDMLKNGIPVKFIDVRDNDNYEESALKTVHIPAFQLEERKRELPAGFLVILDDDIYHGFVASVTLNNMNITEVGYLSEPIKDLEVAIAKELYQNLPQESTEGESADSEEEATEVKN